MQNREYSRSTTVCVTGAAGYIGSWLVRSLLRRGYHVHATVRDAGKASWLQSSLGGIGHLQIFEADRNKKGSFDEAVKDCEFVLHVAASTVFNISAKENIEDRVRKEILEPAVEGTINVLQACARVGTIRRVVFTSSMGTISGRDGDREWRQLVDESSEILIDQVWEMKPDPWVYMLSSYWQKKRPLCLLRRMA